MSPEALLGALPGVAGLAALVWLAVKVARLQQAVSYLEGFLTGQGGYSQFRGGAGDMSGPPGLGEPPGSAFVYPALGTVWVVSSSAGQLLGAYADNPGERLAAASSARVEVAVEGRRWRILARESDEALYEVEELEVRE